MITALERTRYRGTVEGYIHRKGLNTVFEDVPLNVSFVVTIVFFSLYLVILVVNDEGQCI